MPNILLMLFLLDREPWKLEYKFSDIQTPFMSFLVEVLALWSFYKCDNFLVTGSNLDEKQKRLLQETGISNVNEYRKYSLTVDNEFEHFIF